MNQSHKIVTVIGDGSLTGGMSFEALNHAGHLKSDIIVILNDNEMSISKNIGALSSHLSRIMTGEFVSNAREELKKMLKNIPALGDKVYKAAKHIEESIKGFVTPGIIFEQLGFQYFGPVDGHNLNYLIETFKNIKRLKGPIFVHIVTKKGRGYIHAEDDPAKFHGISKFEVETGAPSGDKTEAYTDIFGDAIIELAEKYDKIIAITAAMGLGTGLEKFSKRFPDRFFDIGIAEQHGVTFAAALALGGLKPFVAIYSTFLQRSYDQIILDVCLQGLPVVFAVDRSGIVGQDGPTHHGAFDITYFRHIPNMILMAPKDGEELRHMLYSAYMYDKPTAIRYPRGKVHGPKTFNGFEEIPIGTWEKLRDGDDLAIIACGNTVYPSIQAATELAAEGIQCTVINGRFIKPMDKDMLFETACSKKRILTVEENTLVGGFGGGIMELLSDEGIYASVRRLGMPDKFLTYGTQETLRGKVGLTSEGIKNTIRKWLKNV
ncbi:MAG: 1-deoxy-D-xylulose-5-phosphate synthase [Deltaproteobacteria bacterium ADurb.Bin026]|nr:MAG: 1-deoxy-D-xylulose-5-phosphate synthase [Deltaproteobacteria bacterium ADurb.Bin026]